jgi:23S rRNA pseudouridine2605 synthase
MPKNVPKPPPGDRPLKTLERILSKAGLGSRKDARMWIGDGRVQVNGNVVRDPDAWIDVERDSVAFDGEELRNEERVYLLLHKPVGYLTTNRDPKAGRRSTTSCRTAALTFRTSAGSTSTRAGC